MSDTSTYAACLTPLGTGAIAVVALRGPLAWSAVLSFFRPRSASTPWPPVSINKGNYWLGKWTSPRMSGSADEVVLAVKSAEPVYWVEVHCHGGREVIRWILEALANHGIQVCSWQALEAATSPNSLTAAAAAQLGEALTSRTANILLDQHQGAFQGSVGKILAALDGRRPEESLEILEDLARHASIGRHLTTPWRLTVLGAPNVGKSSLMNALAGYQRSVVTPMAGTTRDVVTTSLAVDGWPVEMADTAGIRENANDLEEQGISRARAAALAADLCLWVVDAASPPAWPDGKLPSVQIIINKIDLSPTWDLGIARNAVHVSALTGQGITALCQTISQWLVPEPPAAGAAIPFTPSLISQVENALRLCRENQWQETRAALSGILSHEG